MADARNLFEQGPVRVVADMVADDDLNWPDFDNAEQERDFRERYDRGDFRYVGMVVTVHVESVAVAESSLWGMEHGTVSDGVEANAWELTPAEYPRPNVVVMGSPLSGLVCEVLDDARRWLIKVDASLKVRDAVRAAQVWADPNNPEYR